MPISDSVGEDGVNVLADVVRVQSLLNEFRRKNGRGTIQIDGKVGPQTIGAIRDFQQATTHVVDGRVDPDGPAIKKLEELIQARVLQVAMLGVLSVISEYDPRVTGIHCDRTVSLLADSILDEHIA